MGPLLPVLGSFSLSADKMSVTFLVLNSFRVNVKIFMKSFKAENKNVYLFLEVVVVVVCFIIFELKHWR